MLLSRQAVLQRSANTLLTALAPIIWGSTYLVTSQWLPEDRPLHAAVLRCLPAGILMLLFCRQWLPWSLLGRWLLLAALNIGGFQALLFYAAYQLPGGLAATLGAMQPLLIMLLIWQWDRRPPGWPSLLAGLVGVLGVALLLFAPSGHWSLSGVIAALASAASMALGTYLAKRWSSSLSVAASCGWQLTLGGAMLLLPCLLFESPLPSLSHSQALAYSYLCLAGALLAYWLWFRGIAVLPAVAVSSLGLLSPFTAVVLGWWWLDQKLSPLGGLGVLLVLASVLAVQWCNSTSLNNSKEPKS